MVKPKRNYFSLLAVLQIGSLVSLPLLVASLAMLFRHQTEDVFLPVWDYVFSFRIAFPPAVIFIIGYLIAFLTGVHLSDTPKVIIRFFRNDFLQSRRAMIFGIGGTLVFWGWALWFVTTKPPPYYTQLVEYILQGEADDFTSAGKAIEAVQSRNSDLGTKYSLAMEVFVERARINLQAAQPNTTRARLLVRALSSDSDSTWSEHPLRKHALAEAYSLLATAVSNSEADTSQESTFGNFSSDALFERSVVLYTEITRSPDPLAIPLMRASALNNLGNAHYYNSNFEAALSAWREANSEELGNRNTSTWGNIVAGLILTKRFKEAVTEGETARNWAEANGKALQETSQFVSIVVNTGFARLALDDMTGALSDFQLADALQGDQNTQLNLALVYVLSEDNERAQRVLRSVGPPADHQGQAAAAISSSEIRCAQLLWFLADPNAPPPDRAARLYVFLGEAWSSSELAVMTDTDVTALRHRVADWLPDFPGNCASFSYFQVIVDAIRG